MSNGVKPTVVIVFGVMNIVFGSICAIIDLYGLIRFIGVSYTAVFGLIFNLAVDGLLVFAGAGLIKDRKNVLMLNQYYIAASVFVTVIVYVSHKIAALPSSTVGAIFGILYPAVLLVLLVNSDEVKRYCANLK